MGGSAKGWSKKGRGRRGRWEGTPEAWGKAGFTSKLSETLHDSGPSPVGCVCVWGGVVKRAERRRGNHEWRDCTERVGERWRE